MWLITPKHDFHPKIMGNSEAGSEQVRVGALVQKDRSTDDVERFLSLLRFDSRAKAEEMMEKGGN